LDIDELGLLHEGVERLSGFYDQELRPFRDLLPAEAVCVLDRPDTLEERAGSLDGEIRRHYEEARIPYPLLSPPEDLFLSGMDTIEHASAGDTLVIAGPAESAPGAREWSWTLRPPEAFGRRLDLLRAHLVRLH